MKAVIILLFLSLALIVLCTQCEKEPEPVNIPDNAFLAALIKQGLDTNGDGAISFEEAKQLNIMNVEFRDIHSLEGIDAIVNLKNLYCGCNQLTSLDVSSNTALEILWSDINQLSSLDISNNTFLWNLDISFMPTLNEVCVWTTPFPPDGVEVYIDGSPNVYFTTECSK